MERQYFFGIDISSEFFTVSVYLKENNTKKTYENFDNCEEGFVSFLNEIQKVSSKIKDVIFCMEATGVYGEKLAYFLFGAGYDIVIENPLKAKRAFGISKKKSDAIDSLKIAEYAYRFLDELQIWTPKHRIVEEIRTLLAQREQLNKQKVSTNNAKKALERKFIYSISSIQTYQDLIDLLTKKIKEIEKEIMNLIEEVPDYKQIFSNGTSIPGVGKILTFNILVLTNGFTENLNSKKLGSYLGIVPEIYQSGTSIRKKSSSSGVGPRTLCKILYLVSMTASVHNKPMKKYFLRKVAEGKNKKLVMNNIANKMLKIIMAIIKSGNSYSENFQSINPVFLKN
jgi:transposase